MNKLPSLDGWRAVAIILVLGEHSEPLVGFPAEFKKLAGWLFDGNLGVCFFFVISGFLISFLLFQEHLQTGKISLPKFYLRRGLRILPVYFCYLLVVFVLQVFTPWRQPVSAWLGNLTFTTNYIATPWTTAHFWTLAVEEQFYLLWPFLLVRWGLRNNLRNVYLLLLLAVVSAPVFRVAIYLKAVTSADCFIFSAHSFFQYFDSLAIGCLAAVSFTYHKPLVLTALNKSRPAGIGFGMVLIFIPYVLKKCFLLGIFTVPFGDTSQAVGFVMLLLYSIEFPEYFLPLNWRVVKLVGILSYSIYVWQMLFCTRPQLFGFPNYWFMTFPGWLLAALGAACVSYYGLEKPLMQLRTRFR